MNNIDKIPDEITCELSPTPSTMYFSQKKDLYKTSRDKFLTQQNPKKKSN